MKRVLFLVLTFTLHSVTALSMHSMTDSTKNYIINSASYNRGIYKTFEEFRSNNPSIVDDFMFTGKKLLLKGKNSGTAKKVWRKEIWGFCDGENIYISHRKYNKILLTGRYCFFEEKGVDFFLGTIAFPRGLVPVPYPYHRRFVVNINDGGIFVLSKSVIRKVFKEFDKELLADFKNDGQRKELFMKYISKYNERHVDQIK
jgi:hypothetical protein